MRNFALAVVSVVFVGAMVGWAPGGDDHAAPAAGVTPAQALQQLQIGHARYLCGKADRPNADAQRRTETFRGGQHPFATILTCADSRVPVEVVFDQGVGDLFVVRVAGNVATETQAGSIEYAVEHLHTPIVVVMGHRACGAVAAAAGTAELPGQLGGLIRTIKPAVEQTQAANPGLTGDKLIAEAIKTNVWRSVEALISNSPVISDHVKQGKLSVIGAVYDLESAQISWLGPHPDESRLLSMAPAHGEAHGDAHGAGHTPAKAHDSKSVGAKGNDKALPPPPTAHGAPAAKPKKDPH